MKAIEIRDALNNSGLPQLAIKVTEDNAQEFTKEEKNIIRSRINDFDNYYKKGWKESSSRKILMDLIGE